MLKYIYMPTDYENRNEPWMFSAEEQHWDDATLSQLRNEYRIVFKTCGDGVHAVMVTEGENLAIGIEDDGTIQFPRHYGQFDFCFSPYWVNCLISDLEEAYRLSGYKERTDSL